MNLRPHPAQGERRPLVARLAAVLAVVAVAMVGFAPAAGAHAVVVSSQPGDRERLSAAPSDVSVTFSEPVSPELGGLTVLNAQGDRVDRGPTSQPEPVTLSVTVSPDLPEGTYVTNYRVISSDGHPVSGALVFSIGTPIDEAGATGVKQQSSPGLEGLGAVGRFAAYVGGLVAAGLAFFLWFIHDQAADRSRLARPIFFAAALGVVGQFVVVAAQSALATGAGLTAVFDASLVSKVVSGSLGWATAALVAGLVACAVSVKVRNQLVAQCLAFYGFVTVAVSFALWGHETEQKWLNLGADVLHAATAALWFGGLVGLTVVLRTRARAATTASAASPSDPAVEAAGPSAVAVLERVDAEPAASPADTVGIVIRFSTLATVSVVLLGLAGLVLAWLEVGSLSALVSTRYGQALIVKLVVVAFVGGLAVYNHFRLLPVVLGEADDPGDPDEEHDVSLDDLVDDPDLALAEPDLTRPQWRRLLVTVRLEAVAVVAVLAVTAVLVNLTPGRTSGDAVNAGPFHGTKPVATGKVDLVISPAQAGPNSIHITFLNTENRPAELAQSVTVEMVLPDKKVGPLTRNATKAGIGHFVVQSTPDMSIAGTWNVTLVSRLGEFEQERTSFAVPITP